MLFSSVFFMRLNIRQPHTLLWNTCVPNIFCEQTSEHTIQMFYMFYTSFHIIWGVAVHFLFTVFRCFYDHVIKSTEFNELAIQKILFILAYFHKVGFENSFINFVIRLRFIINPIL